MNSNISNRTTDIKNRIKDISDTILSKDEEKDNKEVITFFQDGDFLMTLITTDFQGTYSGKGGVTQAPPENIGGGGEEDTPDTDTPPDTDINLPPEEEPSPEPTPDDEQPDDGGGGSDERKIKVGDKVRIKETGEIGIVTGFNDDGTLQIGRQEGSDNFARGGFLNSSQLRTIGNYGEDEIEIIQEEQPRGGTSGTSGSTSGTSGSQGTSGTSGSQGTSGTSGSQGTSGTSGSQGTSGTSGSQGTSGTSGSQGTSGTSGSQGTSGTSGSQGTSGTSGSQGTSGTSGSQGTSGTSRTTSGTSGSSGEQQPPISIENLKRELLERIAEFRNNMFKFPTFIKTFFNVDMTSDEEYLESLGNIRIGEFENMVLLATYNTIFEIFRNPKNNKDSEKLNKYSTFISKRINECFQNTKRKLAHFNLNFLELELGENIFIFESNDSCKLNPLVINELVDFIENISDSPFGFDLSNANVIGDVNIPNPTQDLVTCLQFIENIENLVEYDKESFNIVSKNCIAHPKLFDPETYVEIHLDYVRNMFGNQLLVFSNYVSIDFNKEKITKDLIFERISNQTNLSIYVCQKFNFENNITYFDNVMSRKIDAEPNSIIFIDTKQPSQLYNFDDYQRFKVYLYFYLYSFYQEGKLINDYQYRKLVFENSQFLFNLQYEDKIKQFINDLAFSTQIYGI
jgi:hypothetical protein